MTAPKRRAKPVALYGRESAPSVDPLTLPPGTHHIDGLVYEVTRADGKVQVAMRRPLAVLPNYLSHVAAVARAICAKSTDPAHVREAEDLLEAVELVKRLPPGNARDMALIDLGAQAHRTDVQGALGGEIGAKVRAERARSRVGKKGARARAKLEAKSRKMTDSEIEKAIHDARAEGIPQHKVADKVATELRLSTTRVRQAPAYRKVRKRNSA